jgi:mitochondrial fusion and transport protein UGO1
MSGTSSRDFRELFSDLDYGDYLPQASPSVTDMAKQLLDRALWNYSAILLSQPLEVAKVVLQCYDAGAVAQSNGGVDGRRTYTRDVSMVYSDSESDSDAPSYFAAATPDETPSRKAPRRHTLSRTHSTTSSMAAPSSQPASLTLVRPDSILEVIGQIWSHEGAFGVWKGANSCFIYGILLQTIETWTRSCLSAILNIPDPTLGVFRSIGNPSILDSPSPVTSISVVVLSAGIAGFLLTPIDIVRTK